MAGAETLVPGGDVEEVFGEGAFINDDDELDQSEVDDEPRHEASASEKLDRAMASVEWETGEYHAEINRKQPRQYKGQSCGGQVAQVDHPVDVAWIAKYFGGGTYSVSIKGPGKTAKSRNMTNVIHKSVFGIVIAGPPKLTEPWRGPGDEPEEAKDSAPEAGGNGVTPHVLEKFVDNSIEEGRWARRKLMEGPKQESDTRTLLEFQHKQAALAQKQNSELMQAMLMGAQRDDGTGAIIENMRSAMDQATRDHAREVREQAERHRDEVNRLQQEYSREREQQRDILAKAQADARDEMARREQAVRDNIASQIVSVKENAEAREKALQDLIADLRERLRSAEGKLEAAGRAEQDARLKAVGLEATLQNRPEPKEPLTHLQEFITLGTEVSKLTGNAPAEPTVIDQVTGILASPAASRVGEGIAGLLGNLGSRLGGGGAAAPPPPSVGMEAWQQHVGAGQQVQQLPQPPAAPPKRRRRRVKVAPGSEPEQEVEPEIPEGVEQEPPVEQPSEFDPNQVLQAIEQAAMEEMDHDVFIGQFVEMQGVEPAIADAQLMMLASAPADQVIAEIEGALGQMSSGARMYIRHVRAHLRQRFQLPAEE